MIVVADTTPIRYLVFLGRAEILREIFGTVHVPPEVLRVELRGRRTPEVVRRWAEAPPTWLVERSPSRVDPDLPEKLQRGEIEAISLAIEMSADWMLMDDRDARKAARERGFQVVGTLAILEEGAVRGLVDIDRAVEELKGSNYYATAEQYGVVVENVRRRKG